MPDLSKKDIAASRAHYFRLYLVAVGLTFLAAMLAFFMLNRSPDAAEQCRSLTSTQIAHENCLRDVASLESTAQYQEVTSIINRIIAWSVGFLVAYAAISAFTAYYVTTALMHAAANNNRQWYYFVLFGGLAAAYLYKRQHAVKSQG